MVAVSPCENAPVKGSRQGGWIGPVGGGVHINCLRRGFISFTVKFVALGELVLISTVNIKIGFAENFPMLWLSFMMRVCRPCSSYFWYYQEYFPSFSIRALKNGGGRSFPLDWPIQWSALLFWENILSYNFLSVYIIKTGPRRQRGSKT